MANTRYCSDYYGERLKVGDSVIPITSGAVISNIAGVISKIYFNDNLGDYFLKITNNGETYGISFPSKCFTTEERFKTRNEFLYRYAFNFYDEAGYRIGFLPVTSSTASDFEIPAGTCYIKLSFFEKIVTKDLNSFQDSNHSNRFSKAVFCFWIKGKVNCIEDKNTQEKYLISTKTKKKLDILPTYYKEISSKLELEELFKKVIIYSVSLLYFSETHKIMIDELPLPNYLKEFNESK